MRRWLRRLGVVLAFLSAGSTWFYAAHILVPHEIANAAITHAPRGNLSDLYPRWLGARELLLHHRDPYSSDLTRAIQAGYYGRPLSAENPGDPKDQQSFAYPAYVVFLLAPTINMPFEVARRAFIVLLSVLTCLSVLLWAFVLRWHANARVFALCMVLTLGSIPVVQGIKLQQLSLLVAFLLAASFAAASRGWLLSAGTLLGIATIKPQLAWLAVLMLLSWAVRGWQERQRIVWGFLGTMTLLVLGAEVILPGWLGKFSKALEAYHQYTQNTSLLGWMFSPIAGEIVGLFLLVIGAKFCWPLLKDDAGLSFGIAATFTMVLTVVVVPMVAPYNQVLLLPALMLLAKEAKKLWSQGRVMQLLLICVTSLMAWPWIASLSLASIYFISSSMPEKGWHLPFAATFAFPLILFGCIAYYVARIPSLEGTRIASGNPRKF